jgi:hypothetical protein
MTVMQVVELILRKIAALFGLVWLYCALFNAVVAWRVIVRRKFSPSPIPLAGGICAFLSVLLFDICDRSAMRRGSPLSSQHAHGWVLLLALLLDYGTVPVLAFPLAWGLSELVRLAKRTARRR